LSVVFGLSICTATVNSYSVGNEIILLVFIGVTLVVERYNKKLVMWVTAEKMEMCCYPHIGKNPYLQVVS